MRDSNLVDVVRDDCIALTAPEIAELTGGAWDRPVDGLCFQGVAVAEAEVAAGELYFTLAPGHWSAARLAELHAAGAAGIVVPHNAVLSATDLPILRVDDSREALRRVAEANRDRTQARRILVTGTEGKTGLKIMLHHIMSRQLPCHAVLNSSNLHVPIWRSLASIRRRDRYAIVEISVAQPNRGWQRSAIVRPHFCVITNISPQHTVYHGGLDALIRNKAESVTSMAPGGACLINADNDYYLDLKDAIQRIQPVPVMAFGSGPGCEGRLLHADFQPGLGGWRVQARVFGRSLNYFLPMVNSYAPLASVSALTVAAHLGLDLDEACASLADFQPFETAGRIVTLPVGEGAFTLFDHSHRGSLAGFRSAFDDLYRIAGPRKARLVLGAIRDLAEQEKTAIHRELAGFIDPASTERIYTVGEEMQILRAAFAEPALLGPHGNEPEDIAEALFADIRPGDVVFVKGHHRVWLSHLVEAMEQRFGATDELRPGGLAGPAAVPAEAPAARLVAGGDVMLARDMPGRLAAAGLASAFEAVRPWLAGADVALVNLECVLAHRGDFYDKGEARPYFYRAPPQLIDALVAGGITAVTMANNHAMDFGPEALSEQLDLLAGTGLAGAGAGPDPEAAARPVYLRAGDQVVALVAFATDQPRLAAQPGRAGICQTAIDRAVVDRLRPAMEEARAHADLVVASPHWGANWQERPGEDIRRLAWALVDLGADAILGHSAHILQGVELYRGRPIVYDMGSLLFDRVGEDRMHQSALFELEIGTRGFTRLNIRPVELEPGRARPADAEEGAATLDLIETLSRRLAPGLAFERRDGVLGLALPERPAMVPAQRPEAVHERRQVRPLPEGYAIAPAKVICQALPPGVAADPVDLGDGLAVLAARCPGQVHRGYGFVLEVWFRYPDPGGRRWRASVLGLDAAGEEAFRYRHPVSEGMWVPQQWQGEDIVCDRIVVRPPAGLAAGVYDLYWNLVDADTGNLRKAESGSERLRDGWLHLGRIEVGTAVAAGIAGLAMAGEERASMPGATPPLPTPATIPTPLAGLRRLELHDLPAYKERLAAEPQRLAWQYYFPFLYLFSLTAKSEEFLVAEDAGSLCIYRHNLTPHGWRLHLAFLPMPMDTAVLARCLERARDYNRGRTDIRWVDAGDLDRVRGLPGCTVQPAESEYLFSARRLDPPHGAACKNLRKNLSRFQGQYDHELRVYRPADTAGCLALLDDWTRSQGGKYDRILYERYTRDCLEQAHLFPPADLFGLVVEIDGRIRSFGFGGEMRPGLGNVFITYSDPDIRGLNYFLKYQLIMAMQHHELINSGRADSPGIQYAKESFCPVRMHEVYRVRT